MSAVDDGDAVLDGPLDPAVISRDALLLDALSRDEPLPDADDDIARLLSAWRADLASPAGTVQTLTVRSAAAPALPSLRGLATSPASPANGSLPTVDLAAAEEPTLMVRSVRRPRWRSAPVLAAAAAFVALVGAVTIAAGSARPGSLLWPITTIIFAEHASSLLGEQGAESAIAGARADISAGRYTDAAMLLDNAATFVRQVRDPAVARQLTDQIAALRRQLPASAVPTTPAPTPTAAPGQPTPGQPPAGGSAPPSAHPTAPGVPLPSLPVQLPPVPPLPLPLPLPTLPLPSLPLPGLPLPTIPPL